MMTDAEIEQRIRAIGKEVLCLADLHRAGVFGDITQPGISLRFSQLPVGERPDDWGAVRAGGSITWLNADAAIRFAQHHHAYWTTRMVIPMRKRNAA